MELMEFHVKVKSLKLLEKSIVTNDRDIKVCFEGKDMLVSYGKEQQKYSFKNIKIVETYKVYSDGLKMELLHSSSESLYFLENLENRLNSNATIKGSGDKKPNNNNNNKNNNPIKKTVNLSTSNKSFAPSEVASDYIIKKRQLTEPFHGFDDIDDQDVFIFFCNKNLLIILFC
jgi:hypothetical protein